MRFMPLIPGSKALWLALLVGLTTSAQALDFPGPEPGKAKGSLVQGQSLALSNQALALSWSTFGGRLQPTTFRDLLGGHLLEAPLEAFTLEFQDGTRLKASRMQATAFQVEALVGDPKSVGEAGRLPGQRVSATLNAPNGTLRVHWQATLRDGSNYIRQELQLTALKGDVDLARVRLIDHWLKGAESTGRVAGSPVVADTIFTGLEHPMVRTQLEAGGVPKLIPAPGTEDGPLAPDRPESRETREPEPRWGRTHVQSWLDLALPLREGRSLQLSSVLGVVPPGHLRRGFLFYLERERAHAYRPFLHYNSWYDICYFTPYSDQDCLGVIEVLGRELVQHPQNFFN